MINNDYLKFLYLFMYKLIMNEVFDELQQEAQ